jgi:hypothetical protein
MRTVPLLCIVLMAALDARGAEFQGVLADWQCVKAMVDNGRERTLRENKSCSLGNNYSRSTYGLITGGKKFYRLDDAGRDWALRLLKDTHDKDDLHVIVTGTLDGEVIHVTNMSEL